LAVTDDDPEEKLPYTKLTTKVKRGTGTRDQDTVKVVTRHSDPKQAAVDHQKALGAVRAAAHTARTMQPGEEDDGEVEEP
jgi:hypothetical protein